MNFSPEIKKSESLDTLKGEHLNEGVKPIMGCIYNRENLSVEDIHYLNEFEKNADNQNFKINKEKFLSNRTNKYKEGTYLISGIDNKNIISRDFLDCTGTYFLGVDKNTKENISFISHQNPEALFENDAIRQRFKEDLNKKIDELINKCIVGTIDVVIFGGNDSKDDIIEDLFNDFNSNPNINEVNKRYNDIISDKFDNYRKSIKLLNNIILEKLNFSPVVISGFNNNYETTDNTKSIFADTKNKRISIIGPEGRSVNNESFLAKDVESQISKIKNDSNKK